MERLERRTRRLDAAIEQWERASDLMADQAKQQAIRAAGELLDVPGGEHAVLERALRLEEVGAFEGPWSDVERLQPRLVAGGLLGQPPYPVMEALNLLRLLARAQGTGPAAEAAADFLERVVALNLDFVFPRETEANRDRDAAAFARAARVFGLIIETLPQGEMVRLVVDEIEAICHQRPIWTEPVRRMVRLASRIPGASDSTDHRVDLYVEAVLGPSPMSRMFRDPAAYREALQGHPDALPAEAEAMAASMRATGLVCPQHAVLVRHLVRHQPDLLGAAMDLDERGRQELRRHEARVAGLVRAAAHPATCQVVYGLARLLERGLLDRPDVAAGLDRIAAIQLHGDVARRLMERRSRDGADPATWLLSGAIRVLGQPLGIGQGRNPTCQAARGLSLWSQHRPGYLLDVMARAASEDDVSLYFGDDELHSRELTGGLAWHIDPELDPVSLVLVPHLDRLYDEMMRRVAYLGGDGHRWVNPGLYGRIVPPGFSTCFEPGTWRVVDHEGFLRAFWATHHPDYRDRALVHANPVGIVVTTAHGDLMGLHAVTVQRAEPGPDGDVRVYFYNPNDEGRQDWGQGIQPSVHGHGEEEGESSLPFAQFASRLYAFHHDPYLMGDGWAVPAADIAAADAWARESWGRSYGWDTVASSPATKNVQ